jgi:hypothetical protein
MKIYSPEIIGDTSLTGALDVTGGITGSLFGTASFADSASFAVSASYAPDTTFPYTGNAQITGSLGVTGSISQNPTNLSLSATGALLASANSLISASAVNAVVVASTGSYVSVARPNAAVVASEGSFNNNTNSSTKNTAVVASQTSRVTGTGEAREAFIAGTVNSLNQGSRYSAIIGGENHTLSGFFGNTIAGGGSNSMTQGVYSFIGGGIGNTVGSNTQADYSAIVAGQSNLNNGDNSVIVGGQSNTIAGTFARSVVIGGNGISAAANDTVYVPNFNASGSAVVTGSLIINTPSDGTAFDLRQGTTSAYTIAQGGGFDTSTTIAINATHNFTGGSNSSYRFSRPLTVNSTLLVSGSATFRQDTVFTGSVRGEVALLNITSNTASLNCASDNFFTLQLVSGSDTFIDPSNILPGQTINLRITQPDSGFGTVSFPSSVKQVSGSAYVPTAEALAQDIVTFISFDASNLYLSNVKNLV